MNAHIGRFLTVLKRWEMLRAIMQFYRIRVNSAEYFVVGVIIVVTARQRQLHLLKTFFPPKDPLLQRRGLQQHSPCTTIINILPILPNVNKRPYKF